jgi:hypothetical protein
MAAEVLPGPQPILTGGAIASHARSFDQLLAIGHVPKVLVLDHAWPTFRVPRTCSRRTNVELI